MGWGIDMVDHLSEKQRSELMGRIRSKHTKPELTVRRLVFSLGYRYRLHRRELPGIPDLVFPSRKKAIFVHGCFWHRHEGCSRASMPKSNAAYWSEKLERNVERDALNRAQLRSLGWDALQIWECEIKGEQWVRRKIVKFLES